MRSPTRFGDQASQREWSPTTLRRRTGRSPSRAGSGTPTLSPDGKRIAYVSDEAPEKKLMVQELAGGQPHEVFSAPEVGHLRWSPDGTELMLWARGSG